MEKIDVLKRQQNPFDSMKVDVEIKNRPQLNWPTLLMAMATFMLAFIAFSQYTIEARPMLFISEISRKSTVREIIYTLYNSGSGSAYDVDIVFRSKFKFLDKDHNLVKEIQMVPEVKRMSHFYPKQQKISVLNYTEGKKAKEFPYYTINIDYEITYKGKLFLFINRPYSEKGSIGLNPATRLWLINPD